MAETMLERLAWADYDQAAAAFKADPSEENRLAWLAAVYATAAAVQRAIETDGPDSRS